MNDSTVIPKLIDTHCHFDDPVFGDWQQALEDLPWLKALVVPGIGPDNWPTIASMAKTSKRVWPCYGLHPYFIDQFPSDALHQLERFLENHDPVAIGEIGLDLYTEPHTSRFDQQYELLKKQLFIAKGLKKPVVLHIRKAEDYILKALRETHFTYGGFAHAYGGSLQQAQRLVDFGFKLGVGGSITYDRANKLRKVVKGIGIESLVLETDAPYLPPSFAREKANHPRHIYEFSQYLQQVLDVDLEVIQSKTTQNAMSVLGYT